ncbi:MAG: hypothetical protein HKM94_03795, partial [Halobacteria archaeon]|nr:hypothetical protein [Halobacteria archaeon]
QILYYEPVSEKAERIHQSTADLIGVMGGNRSSKTESALAEAVVCATGILPNSLQGLEREALKKKFRGPIRVMVICESLINTLHTTILSKLKWWIWTGVDPDPMIDQSSEGRGHYGWVPRNCLINGDWGKSWSEKYRELTVTYRNPEDHTEVLGYSVFKFMSHSQDPEDFASGHYHLIVIDEPTELPIWRECQARVLSANGRIILSMTWPDEPVIPVEWIYDEVMDNAAADIFELSTLDNKTLDQEQIRKTVASWSDEMKEIRVFGRSLRLKNLVHPDFADQSVYYCFTCTRRVQTDLEGNCTTCKTPSIKYCNVERIDPNPRWPTVLLMDPHPRKPHMYCWAQISMTDDIYIIKEGKCDCDAADTVQDIKNKEYEMGLIRSLSLIDPSMGMQPADGKNRGITWRDVFYDCGLAFDLADNSSVGRKILDQYLLPDLGTLRPRLVIDEDCHGIISQMKRYKWDDHKKKLERAQKQVPKTKNDDYPTLLKYLMNYAPSYVSLSQGPPIIQAAKHGKQKKAKKTIQFRQR